MKKVILIVIITGFVFLNLQTMEIDFSASKNSPQGRFTDQMVAVAEGTCGCAVTMTGFFCDNPCLQGVGLYLVGATFADVAADEYEDMRCDVATCSFLTVLAGLCCCIGLPENTLFLGGLATSSSIRLGLKMIKQKLRKEKED